MSTSCANLEKDVRAAQARGDYDLATTLVLAAYGREVLGFLIARLGEHRGHDVFSEFLEDVWRGLPRFEWRSGIRTWLYVVARHAMSRHARSPHRRRETIELSEAITDAAERARTTTAGYLKTEVKDRWRKLRAQLPDSDQTLLFLRVDRGLAWRDLALVMTDADDEGDERELAVRSGRLRTQFARAKARLKQLAEADGLLPSRRGTVRQSDQLRQ